MDKLLLGLSHETLVAIGPDGQPRPGLARSWTRAALGREWTLTLDEQARFHDDAPVTAAQAVRSIRRFLAGGTTAARRLSLALEPDGVGASDAGAVVLRFREADARALVPLASLAAAVTGSRGVGCGPFVPTLAIPGSRLAFTAFGGHWRGRPYLDALAVVAVPEDARRHADLLAGRTDLAFGEPGLSEPASTLLLVLDATRAPFDKPAAREAVARAIDRAALVREYVAGGAVSLTPVPPSIGAGRIPHGLARGGGARIASAPITLAVASDVAPALSQRVLAHLDALGLRASVSVLDPGAARLADSEARLFLFSPEVAEPELAFAEAMALASREPATLLPLAAVPVAIGSRAGLHGARIDAAGRIALDDVWLDP
jgi:ABC-type transport system substrate-binding protein